MTPPRPRPLPRPAPATRQQPTAAVSNGGEPLLYTPEEAAALLKVRPSWLRKKAAARLVPCTFLGRHLRFSPTDLAAIITAAAQPATGRRARRRGPARRDHDLPSAHAHASIDTTDEHIP